MTEANHRKVNLAGMGRGFTARLVVFPISALASFVSTGLIIRYAGADLYGVIALVASLFLLVPFADLGTGAVIVNSYSRPEVSDQRRLAATRRVVKVLIGSAAAIAVLGWLGTFAWSWSLLLGVTADHDRVDLATALSVTVFALSIPLSLGTRILVGLHRVATMTVLAPIGSVTALGLVVILIGAGTPPIWLTLALPTGQLVTQLATLAVALRVARLRPRALWGPSDFTTREVLTTSLPMVVIMVTLPSALHSHRIVLSLLSNPTELAVYSLSMQFYQPIWSFITAAATPLWPLWSSVRDSGARLTPLFVRTMLILAGLGFAALVGLVLVGPSLGNLVSGGEIVLTQPILVVTGVLLAVQAAQQAPGMFLTDPTGLRFQAVCAIIATAISIGGSIALVPRSGALAPSLVTAIGIGLAQTIPGLLAVRSRLARTRLVASLA